MKKNRPNLTPADYYDLMDNPLHKQYLVVRAFFVEKASAKEIAKRYGYTTSTVYSYIRDFKEKLKNGEEDPFFKTPQIGRKKLDRGRRE